MGLQRVRLALYPGSSLGFTLLKKQKHVTKNLGTRLGVVHIYIPTCSEISNSRGQVPTVQVAVPKLQILHKEKGRGKEGWVGKEMIGGRREEEGRR